MVLDEARLKSLLFTRPGEAVAGPSGMTTEAEPTELAVQMDLQSDGAPRLVDSQGEVRFVGTFTGFTYSPELQIGDRLLGTTHGALRVESIQVWDDEEPTHYQVGLVPA